MTFESWEKNTLCLKKGGIKKPSFETHVNISDLERGMKSLFKHLKENFPRDISF